MHRSVWEPLAFNHLAWQVHVHAKPLIRKNCEFKDPLQLRLGNVIDLDQLIDLYHDRIAFESTVLIRILGIKINCPD